MIPGWQTPYTIKRKFISLWFGFCWKLYYEEDEIEVFFDKKTAETVARIANAAYNLGFAYGADSEVEKIKFLSKLHPKLATLRSSPPKSPRR